MPELVMNGVPRSLMRDAWWLGPDDGSGPRRAGGKTPGAMPAVAVPGLMALADVLFWRQTPGLSLALFALAILVVAGWGARGRLAGPLALLCLGALPVIEYVQPLSLAFLAAALVGALVWLRQPQIGLAGGLAATVRLIGRLPLGGLRALWGGLRHSGMARQPGETRAGLRRFLRRWAFPLGGTLVFAGLLMDANPMIARLFDLHLDIAGLIRRAVFWAGVGLLLWPLLDARTAPGDAFLLPRLPAFGINAASTLRALILFNLMIGLQTALDLSILLGGAGLPQDMTYADYAHRGAYPLLATALLAGAFALAARPFLAEHRLIRPLMLLWLGQNVALSLSALLRLDLYIETFGLTYLRVRALIWIALVAVGLGLLAWQMARGRPNRWFLLRAGGLGIATLYVCCFVNFAALIAAQNLTKWPRDLEYLCHLGPTAAAALAAAPPQSPDLAEFLQSESCIGQGYQIGGWRDWGFRYWRVARYQEQTSAPEPAHGHPDRR